MAVSQIDRVWKHSKAKGAVLLLMLAIADNANDEGYAYPGTKYLARKCRMSERHIPRLIEQAEHLKELKVIRETGKVNRYWILTPYPRQDGRGQDVTPDSRVRGTPDKFDKTPDIAESYEPLTVNINPKLKELINNHSVEQWEKIKDLIYDDQIKPGSSDRLLDSVTPITTNNGTFYLAVNPDLIKQYDQTYLKIINNFLTGGYSAKFISNQEPLELENKIL